MKTVLAAILLLGIVVFGMCFNIIFRGKEFPNSDVGSNPEMRKRGIKCMREVDDDIMAKERQKKCSGNYSASCKSCGFYTQEK